MKKAEKNEKLVRDLMETFEDGSKRHKAYKEIMKVIILDSFIEISDLIGDDTEGITGKKLNEWIDKYVEKKFTRTNLDED